MLYCLVNYSIEVYLSLVSGLRLALFDWSGGELWELLLAGKSVCRWTDEPFGRFALLLPGAIGWQFVRASLVKGASARYLCDCLVGLPASGAVLSLGCLCGEQSELWRIALRRVGYA